MRPFPHLIWLPAFLAAGCIIEADCEEGHDTGVADEVPTDTGAPVVTEPPIQDCTEVLDVTEITEDLTITADCVTEIPSYVWVDGDAVVTVEPGARIAFGTDAGLGIARARLVIEGTAAQPVVLTSADSQQPGAWSGIHFESEALRGQVLRHAIVEYGGARHSAYEQQGTYSLAWVTAYESGTFEVEHTLFRHNLYGGIGVWSQSGGHAQAGLFGALAGNTFTDNGGLALRLPCNVIADLAPDNVLDEPVHVSTHWFQDDRAWPDLGVPYVIEASLQLAEADSELHVDGLELQFERGTDLELSAGGMWATDTVFTSAAQTPVAGDWGGIFVGFLAVAVIEDSRIEYVGSGSYETLGFQNDSALYSTLTGTTFANNAGASNLQAQVYCDKFTDPGAGNVFDLTPCVQ